MNSGYWGEITSSIDWCEENYDVTYYIAEFFNTISSFAMVVVGFIGFFLHRKILPKRFAVVFLGIALVGLGSAAFHGTLLFHMQMWDELPMLYTSYMITYCLLEREKKRRYGMWLPSLLVIMAIITTYATAHSNGSMQFFWFHSAFDTSFLFNVYLLYRLFQTSKNTKEFKGAFHFAIIQLAFGYFCWNVDLYHCEFVSQTVPEYGLPNPQLHAWWHLFVSTSVYTLTLVCLFETLTAFDQKPQFRYIFSVFPIITVGTEVTKRKGRRSKKSAF